MLLFVVEDRCAERPLRDALASAARSGAAVAVLTADALLAMQLRREGIDARLTSDGLTRDRVDELDRVALDAVATAYGDGSPPEYASVHGTPFGAYLEYTLIPSFVRAVRNVAAADGALTASPAPDAIVLVGGGALVKAARLVSSSRGIRARSIAGNLIRRTIHAAARLMAGRTTRWVNTDFRALVLEPGFIWLLFLKGFWNRLFAPAPPPLTGAALIVIGDRFTADVVARLRGARPIVLAGATQPGRALFESSPDLIPIESFSEPRDLARWLRSVFAALADAVAMWRDADRGRRFVVAGSPCWPLVRRSVVLHLPAWMPALRHLQVLGVRAAGAAPGAALLASTDVTAYNRLVIDTLRRSGIASTGIQHGIVGQANGHDSVQVDRLATWGATTEATYRGWAATRARVTLRARFVVTGNPRFDGLACRVRERRTRAPEPRGDAPFTVTACTGFVSDFSVAATEYENLLMLDDLLAWAGQHANTRVIHKMHPGEEARHYELAASVLRWDPQRLTRVSTPTLYDELQRSDVMVAAYSTTILESAALGTPAIVMDAVVVGGYGLLALDRIRGVSIAKSRADLNAQLTARMNCADDGVPAPDDPALVGYIGTLDGHAAERIAQLIDVT
ncbi:MAG TPA: hypothetical protein VKE51_07275 [Vicinamibacterales bacterium]|nr:hypothetical protein [Vicinamibacterales bacterium]